MAAEDTASSRPEAPPWVGELLLEVRADELPPRLLPALIQRFATRFFEELMSRGLGPESLITGCGRRRLVVCCRGLPPVERAREERRLGPPVAEAFDEDGRATDALRTFAAERGVAPEAVARARTERGERAAVIREVPGRGLAEVVVELVPKLLAELAPEEGMRWAEGREPWIRPVRGLLALLDGEVLPIEFGGVAAGRESVGHPILSPGRFAVGSFLDYRAALAERGIVISLAARRDALREALAARAEALGAAPPIAADGDGEEVVRRMALACEIPGLIDGAFDPALLELPEEVVVAVLAQHPGALVLRGKDPGGALLPRFVTVMDRPDDPEGRVRTGYERVVEGRLADARFHLESDLETPLAERARALEQHAMVPGHGTWADHGRRLQALLETLCEKLDRRQLAAPARQAATLLAADRDTELVAQLPALQGILGGLQARAEGYPDEVWQAVYDQNLPASRAGAGRGTGDDKGDAGLPRGALGRLVAVAALTDRLVAALGSAPLPPAGRDRHGLRRLALGAVRILMAGDPPLDVDLLVVRAVLLHGEALRRGYDETVAECGRLLLDRARRELGRMGFAFDEIEAAIAIRHGDLADLRARVRALHEVRGDSEFGALVRAAKRLAPMVEASDEYRLAPELLTDDAERALHDTLGAVRRAVDEAVAARRYERGLRAMAELTAPLDRFFEGVLVMDEDEGRRRNRIALLQAVRRIFWRIARLRELEVR